MQYGPIRPARFLARPNRFVALAELDGEQVVCHVKNTGRCRELLSPGCTVYLEKSGNPDRKTAYSLVAVDKGGRLINMDSQAPNRAAREWLEAGGLGDFSLIRPETVYGGSRFDFYLESPAERGFLEVKGVTLEEDGVVLFPDAPTQRGVKHLEELQASVRAGYSAWVLFVVQVEGVRYFTPNRKTHPAFAQALYSARDAGVRLLAWDCRVTPDSMSLRQPVSIRL